jgi:hypothetical protein
VSRWDWLNDMIGVMHGFAEHVAPFCDAYLTLAGPAADGVSDDPEGRGRLRRMPRRVAPSSRRTSAAGCCSPSREWFVGDLHLLRYAWLLDTLIPD